MIWGPYDVVEREHCYKVCCHRFYWKFTRLQRTAPFSDLREDAIYYILQYCERSELSLFSKLTKNKNTNLKLLFWLAFIFALKIQILRIIRLNSRPYNLHRSCPSANCLPHWSKVDIFRAGARRADIWQFSKTELSQRRLWNSGEITTNLHPAFGICTCPICSWFVNPLTVKSSFVWILSLLLSAWVQKWNSIS